MRQVTVTLLITAGLALTACEKSAPETTTTAENKVVTPAASIDTTSSASLAPATTPAPMPASDTAPVGSFDTAKASVSAVTLGAFPYLALPDGYVAGSPQTLDLARFPFWVGDHYVWIEGKVYQASIEVGSSKEFSKYELQKNIENLIAQAGGRKIAETQLPSGMRSKLNPDAQQVDKGLGDIISNPTVVFLIHRADKDIWVHFTASTSRGSWAIVETKAFVPTAKLLPASVLRDSIDKLGKATIAVNFAVDQATILPASQPRLGEVVKLLADLAPKLSVEGHTDNSGTPAHNRALSQARAKSVVAALVSAGVQRDRLAAQGFDASKATELHVLDAANVTARPIAS